LGVWNARTRSLYVLKGCTPEERFYMC